MPSYKSIAEQRNSVMQKARVVGGFIGNQTPYVPLAVRRIPP